MAKIIEPHPGFQTKFGMADQDIVLGGGAAFGGKSYMLANIPLAYCRVPNFQWGFARRTYPELTGPGSLWEETLKQYPMVGGKSDKSKLAWRFPTSGVICKLFHLQHEKSVEAHKSKAYGYIGVDEATTLTEHQWNYIWSRVRSLSGIRAFMRAATNPDPDSFLRKWVEPFLNCDGYPDLQKCGNTIYWGRLDDELLFDWDPDQLMAKTGKKVQSFTYLPGFAHENTTGLAQDPGYLDKLDNMPLVERERLLLGNWHVRKKSGDFFDRAWFMEWDPIYNDTHRLLSVIRTRQVRGWDLAATPVKGDQIKPVRDPVGDTPRDKDPDWTVGVKMSQLKANEPLDYVIEDMIRVRDRSAAVQQLIIDTAIADGPGCEVAIWQEPGQAGKDQAERIARTVKAKGITVHIEQQTQNKEAYASALSREAWRRRFGFVHGAWNQTFFNEMENFPPPKDQGHDDIVEAASRAFMIAAKPGVQTLAYIKGKVSDAKMRQPIGTSGLTRHKGMY